MTTGLRIGELAALGGVSARAVRHYHRVGVLPEPARRANGYRVYGLVDVVRLLRVRRLLDLGLSLSEVAAVLDAGDDVRDLLGALAEDLREQERRLARRREQVEALLAQGGDPVRSDRLGAVLTALGDTASDPREALVAELTDAVTGSVTDSHVRAARHGDAGARDALWAAFDELVGRSPDDPAVAALARRAADQGFADMGSPADVPGDGDPLAAARLEQAVTADLDPAQARCVRLMFALIRERTA